MSVIEYIILAFALTLPTMLAVRSCAQTTPIRLTRGLVLSLLWGVEHALLLALGMYVGETLCFKKLNADFVEYDKLVYLGLMLVVAIRMFFSAFRKSDKAHPAFDISRWSTSLLLGVATGTNALFVGLGLGFLVDVSTDLWRVIIPLMIVIFLLSYLAIMLGRRKKEMRERRWLLIAVLFLLIFAFKGAFFGE